MTVPTSKAASSQEGNYRRIYSTVQRIPEGRVATYGQIAALAGLPGHARQVGYALHATPAELSIPWHRVINARGEVSARVDPGWAEGYQRHLLEEEGVEFNLQGRVNLKRFRWHPTDETAPRNTADSPEERYPDVRESSQRKTRR